MDFHITGLKAELFEHLFGMNDAALAARGVERVRVTEPNAAPCRVSLMDIAPGGSALLLNWEHQPAANPYRSRHAIFVEDGAAEVRRAINEIPDPLRIRPLSLRAFDADHRMVDAELAQGEALASVLVPILARDDTAYVQIH